MEMGGNGNGFMGMGGNGNRNSPSRTPLNCTTNPQQIEVMESDTKQLTVYVMCSWFVTKFTRQIVNPHTDRAAWHFADDR